MSAPKFTPGPWRVGQWLGGAWCVTSAPLSQPRGGEITSVVYGPLSGTPEGNARLIAAAPELLAIAREYADSCLDCSGSGTVQRYDTDDSDCAVTEFVDCPECAHVRAVIAAVEGA